MSIKTGSVITTTDINNLKSSILTLYHNRTVNVGWTYPLNNGNNYYHMAAKSSNKTIGETIDWFSQNLIDACLIVNDIPNLKSQ